MKLESHEFNVTFEYACSCGHLSTITHFSGKGLPKIRLMATLIELLGPVVENQS